MAALPQLNSIAPEYRKATGCDYATPHEVRFIEGLGSFSPGQAMPRRDLLVMYQAALATRRVWEGIDRAAVLEELERTIAGC